MYNLHHYYYYTTTPYTTVRKSSSVEMTPNLRKQYLYASIYNLYERDTMIPDHLHLNYSISLYINIWAEWTHTTLVLRSLLSRMLRNTLFGKLLSIIIIMRNLSVLTIPHMILTTLHIVMPILHMVLTIVHIVMTILHVELTIVHIDDYSTYGTDYCTYWWLFYTWHWLLYI